MLDRQGQLVQAEIVCFVVLLGRGRQRQLVLGVPLEARVSSQATVISSFPAKVH